MSNLEHSYDVLGACDNDISLVHKINNNTNNILHVLYNPTQYSYRPLHCYSSAEHSFIVLHVSMNHWCASWYVSYLFAAANVRLEVSA